MAADGDGASVPSRGPGKSARNEQRKLLAAWLNTLASATVTVGVLAPAAGFMYGFSIPGADRAPWLLGVLPVAWFSLGVVLHLVARTVAGGLEE